MYKMAVKEKQTELSFEEIEWNVENEIQLFFSMNGHKPVGKMRKPAQRFEVMFTNIVISNSQLQFNELFLRCQQIFSHGVHMGEISCCHSQGCVIEDDLGSFGIYV